MRIAMVPNPTFRNLEGESEFLMFRQYARDILSVRKAHVYMVIPSWCQQPPPEEGITYLVDDADRNLAFADRIAAVPIQFPQWFNARFGKYPVDAVHTTRTAAVSQMNKYLVDFRDKARIPVILDENMALDESHFYVGPEDLVARTLGYATAAHNFFDISFEMERAISTARMYLSARQVRRVIDNSTIVPCGISMERIANLTSTERRSRKFQLMYGNRLNASKKPEQLMELYNRFYAAGRNVNIVITTPMSGAFLDKLKDKAHVKMYKDLQSDDFVRMAARSHVFVETTAFGGFSLGLSEIICAGPVVLLPRLHWIHSFVGDKVWREYPYFFDDMTEAAVILRRVYDNFEEADRHMEMFRDYWRKNFDSKLCSMRMLGIMEEQIQKQPRGGLWSPGNMELIRQALREMKNKGLEKFHIEQLYMYMVDNSKVMDEKDMKHPLRGKISKWGLYRWLCQNGWEDTCTGPQAVFVRKEN